MSRKSLGRALISLTSLVTAVGPYRVDWNETHVHNPAWPPHAKFHNGQTMSLGLTLGATSLWQLWRRLTKFTAGSTAAASPR